MGDSEREDIAQGLSEIRHALKEVRDGQTRQQQTLEKMEEALHGTSDSIGIFTRQALIEKHADAMHEKQREMEAARNNDRTMVIGSLFSALLALLGALVSYLLGGTQH